VQRDATEKTREITATLREKHTGFLNQRTADQFKVKHKQTDRACRKDPDYVPEYVNFPLQVQEMTIPMTEADMANLQALIRRNQGSDPEDAFRSAVMTWHARHRTPQIVPEALDLDL
jgi:hypothetical protein